MGYGFGCPHDIRNTFIYPANDVTYTRCEVSGCQVGFDTFYHINSEWDRIISALNNIRRGFFCNKCSECPDVPDGEFNFITVDNIAKNYMIPCCIFL